jgi:hypothetical protein
MSRIMIVDSPVSAKERGEGGGVTFDTGASAFIRRAPWTI